MSAAISKLNAQSILDDLPSKVKQFEFSCETVIDVKIYFDTLLERNEFHCGTAF